MLGRSCLGMEGEPQPSLTLTRARVRHEDVRAFYVMSSKKREEGWWWSNSEKPGSCGGVYSVLMVVVVRRRGRRGTAQRGTAHGAVSPISYLRCPRCAACTVRLLV